MNKMKLTGLKEKWSEKNILGLSENEIVSHKF